MLLSAFGYRLIHQFQCALPGMRRVLFSALDFLKYKEDIYNGKGSNIGKQAAGARYQQSGKNREIVSMAPYRQKIF